MLFLDWFFVQVYSFKHKHGINVSLFLLSLFPPYRPLRNFQSSKANDFSKLRSPFTSPQFSKHTSHITSGPKPLEPIVAKLKYNIFPDEETELPKQQQATPTTRVHPFAKTITDLKYAMCKNISSTIHLFNALRGRIQVVARYQQEQEERFQVHTEAMLQNCNTDLKHREHVDHLFSLVSEEIQQQRAVSATTAQHQASAVQQVHQIMEQHVETFSSKLKFLTEHDIITENTLDELKQAMQDHVQNFDTLLVQLQQSVQHMSTQIVPQIHQASHQVQLVQSNVSTLATQVELDLKALVELRAKLDLLDMQVLQYMEQQRSSHKESHLRVTNLDEQVKGMQQNVEAQYNHMCQQLQATQQASTDSYHSLLQQQQQLQSNMADKIKQVQLSQQAQSLQLLRVEHNPMITSSKKRLIVQPLPKASLPTAIPNTIVKSILLMLCLMIACGKIAVHMTQQTIKPYNIPS